MKILSEITAKQYRIALVTWTVIVLILLLMPASSFSNGPKFIHIPHVDKIAHFILFGTLSFLLFKNAEFVKNKFFSNLYLSNTVIIFLFGLMTEILQGIMYNTAKRNFSLGDLAFDTLASIIVMLAMHLFKRRNISRK